MSGNFDLWLSDGVKSVIANNQTLALLVDDFCSYYRGELDYHGLNTQQVGYLNAQYAIGRDVPFDRGRVKILGDDYPNDYRGTCSHTHLVDRTLTTSNDDQQYTYSELTRKRHLRSNQDKWTSDAFLVYYEHAMKRDHVAILDFWLVDAHGKMDSNQKSRLMELIRIYEESV